MKYVELNDDNMTVKLILNEYDENFPGLPITSRYSKEYLDSCIAVNDDVDVDFDYIYDKKNKTFKNPSELLNEDEDKREYLDKNNQTV